MEATDLMIGDLVLINETPRKIQGIDSLDSEIIADGEIYTLAEDRYHSEDKVDGVHLTPEILEKNGFEMTKQESWWSEWKFQPKNGGRTIFITNINCINGGYDFGCYREGIFVDFFNIKDAHELQHALRLCGIEKEIVL